MPHKKGKAIKLEQSLKVSELMKSPFSALTGSEYNNADFVISVTYYMSHIGKLDSV